MVLEDTVGATNYPYEHSAGSFIKIIRKSQRHENSLNVINFSVICQEQLYFCGISFPLEFFYILFNLKLCKL
jgi:hypothetical protein